MASICGRRPWLAQICEPDLYGFSSRSTALSRPDVELGERLIAAYRLSQEKCPVAFRPKDVWRDFIDRHYTDMLEMIRRGDAAALVDYLFALPMRGAGHGYFQGQPAFDALRASPPKQRERALWLLDHLMGLAEAQGVVRLRCPEQGEWQAPAWSSLGRICEDIESSLGIPIRFPPLFDGLFALQTPAGPCHLRSMMAAYAVHEIGRHASNLKTCKADELRVAEIGAGIGFTAFAAAQLGMARYSVFDLPEINVAQGFFLLVTLGPDQVRLYGESSLATTEVLPPWAFEEHITDGYDVVLNIDSFPEIDRTLTRRYLQTMQNGGRLLFSINQEAPRGDRFGGPREAVREMVAGHGGFTPLLRSPNWIRQGYADELFRIDATGSVT